MARGRWFEPTLKDGFYGVIEVIDREGREAALAFVDSIVEAARENGDKGMMEAVAIVREVTRKALHVR